MMVNVTYPWSLKRKGRIYNFRFVLFGTWLNNYTVFVMSTDRKQHPK